jgi:hypothetical protein
VWQQQFAVLPPVTETEMEQRRLLDYDAAFGADGFDAGVGL